MDKNVNMAYRFTSDEEPTDEQLLVIMKEVEADVRQKSFERKNSIKDNLKREYDNARAMFPDL
ncbi:hypothetical protein AGMMS50239_11260 [Bacteroidia bacterium]|nr:hypothetical protein FACS1894207_1350 [Bacteroidia bacterium]GHT61087.1 hypothetical protein AGMMS50239_11260 [Bacteroidia bacterium]GHV31481.1 hypothetical protein FACS1894177_06200 [Bacteroidia bacterium]